MLFSYRIAKEVINSLNLLKIHKSCRSPHALTRIITNLKLVNAINKKRLVRLRKNSLFQTRPYLMTRHYFDELTSFLFNSEINFPYPLASISSLGINFRDALLIQ